MNKNMKRLLSLLLCLCMIFGTMLSLSSCFDKTDEVESESESGAPDNGGNNGDVTPPADSESETEEEKHYSLNLSENGVTEYVIIVPNKKKDFTDDMLTAVNQLIKAFKNFTGATITFKTDYLGYDENYKEILPDENALEILIGNTNRHQSADAVADLGFGEYIIKADGNKLVINGTTEATIIAAINRFTEKNIQGNSNLGYGKTDVSFVFTSDNNYKKESSYQIKSININGKKISEMTLIYPDGDMVAKYIATLIRKHLFTWSGMNLDVISDKSAGVVPGIHIGKTKRSTTTAANGKYQVEVTDRGLEVAVNDMFSYAAAYNTIVNEVFVYSNAHIKLEMGQKWEDNSVKEANAARTTDIRLMYHNVWGYMITAAQIAQGSLPNPVVAPNVNRYAIAVEVYKTYAPDVICFQELSTDRNQIEDQLLLMGYNKVNSKGGTLHQHHSVWYKDSKLEVVNYGTNKGWSHYHSSWIIFKVKSTGEQFGVCNSHFTANSMVSQSDVEMIPQLGDEARIVDAQSLLKSVEAAKAAGPAGMPIFTGGDYNCVFDSNAYRTLLNGGLTNVRDLADVSANISCHHGVSYDEDFGAYKLPGKIATPVDNAIDHIMLWDAENAAVDIKEYGVIGDRLTAVSSDHAPHFVDFNFN